MVSVDSSGVTANSHTLTGEVSAPSSQSLIKLFVGEGVSWGEILTELLVMRTRRVKSQQAWV